MELFKKINRLTVAKEIMLQIKEAILNGQLKSGEKIPSERELTERFNVSRNMVREAIRGLEMSGYLEIQQGPFGGAFVKDFTHDRLSTGFLDFYIADKLTVHELNQARLYLEPEVARLAAKNIHSKDRKRIRDALKEEIFAEKLEDRLKSLTAVHLVLAEMCDNYFYEIWVNSLIRITHEIVLNTFQAGDVPIHGTGQHDQIVEMVLEGNPEGAAQAMKDHLIQFAEAFIALDKKYRKKMSMDSPALKGLAGK
ncbi:MAG: FadR family transcriptional regulator [Deltaproteobacteria bacterium]|nr:FadR family transcriptional regulator [Deltaproteobacteria bacterium]